MPTAPRKPADHQNKAAVEPVMDPRGKVEGKTFVWTDDGTVLTIPLRIKMGVLRRIGLGEDLDPATMFAMIEAIAPDQAEAIDDLDVNSFVDAFSQWQATYNARAGASLGESSDSST